MNVLANNLSLSDQTGSIDYGLKYVNLLFKKCDPAVNPYCEQNRAILNDRVEDFAVSVSIATKNIDYSEQVVSPIKKSTKNLPQI